MTKVNERYHKPKISIRSGKTLTTENIQPSALELFTKRIAQIVVLLTPIINVLWVPVYSSAIGGGANATYLDLLLVVGWVAAFLRLLQRRPLSKQEKRAWSIVFLVNLPLILSPLASSLIADGNNLVGGVLSHFKRIGMASILVPLSLYADFPKLRIWFLISILISVGLLYFGPPSWIDMNQELLIAAVTSRNTSLLFNPNSVAFVSGINILVLFVMAEQEKNRLFWLALILGIILSTLTFTSGASRGGTLGLLAGLLYFIVRRRSTYLFIILWIFFFLGLWIFNTSTFHNSVFASRWSEVFVTGGRVDNLETRLEYQKLAVERSFEYPIGTGINSNLSVQTDSVFFDYLSAMGFIGLVSIVSVFGIAWKSQTSNKSEAMLGRSVILNALIFSTAALGVASPFVSPLFFLTLGWGLSVVANEVITVQKHSGKETKLIIS